MTSYRDLLFSSRPQLTDLDSTVLLCNAAGISKESLFIKYEEAAPDAVKEIFLESVRRRKNGEPVAYITGRKEFWGMEFEVSPAVLVPRPESELIVEITLKYLEDRFAPFQVADMGTGSGCLAIAIASELAGAGEVFAADQSDEALKIAKRNAERNHVAEDIRFFTGNWFDALPEGSEKFDVIVTNPPYLSENDALPVELSFEPRTALFSEGEGLRDIQYLLGESHQFLKPDGILVMEIGCGKRKAVEEIIPQFSQWKNFEFRGDLTREDGFTILVAVMCE